MRLPSLDEPSSSPVRCQRRFDVIKPFLRLGGVGAEVGVFKGAFIDYLLQSAPSKLYAVDPWYRLAAEWPWAKGDRSTTTALIAILSEYSSEIAQRTLEPRVAFSAEFFEATPDRHFDWIYLDTTHQYELTRKELAYCLRKVKLDGFIIGDDFNSNPEHPHHGVYKAVKELEAAGWLRLHIEGEAMQFVASIAKTADDA